MEFIDVQTPAIHSQFDKFENESLKFEHKLSCILILTLSSAEWFYWWHCKQYLDPYQARQNVWIWVRNIWFCLIWFLFYLNMNKSEKYHPTTIKTEMDWSKW